MFRRIAILLVCAFAIGAAAPPAGAAANDWIRLPRPLEQGTQSSHLGVRAVTYALAQLDRPYVWGGAGPRVFDCSGLVVWSFNHAGRRGLGHYTGWLWRSGPHIARNRLRAGDLVFFHGGEHMGMYLFGDFFIQAPHTGDVVKISRLRGPYRTGYYGAVRILPATTARGGPARPVHTTWQLSGHGATHERAQACRQGGFGVGCLTGRICETVDARTASGDPLPACRGSFGTL